VGNRCLDDDDNDNDDDDDDFACFALSGKKGSTQAGQVLKDSKSFKCCMMEFIYWLLTVFALLWWHCLFGGAFCLEC
jgi:hypothetical protein